MVSHVNIRLSISFLLLKLLVLELIAATGVVLCMSISLSEFVQNAGFELPGISAPIYLVFVAIKTLVTMFIILQWLNEYYEISPALITHRKGIIFRFEEKYPLKDMKKIKLEQTFLGRILNYGTLTLEDAFKIEKIRLYQIHNPVRYAGILEEVLPDEVEVIHEVRRHIYDEDKADITVN